MAMKQSNERIHRKATYLRFGHPDRIRDAAILAHFLVVARAKKAWAARTKDNHEWVRNACKMSLDMLLDYASQSTEEIACRDYDYFQYRANLIYSYGGLQVARTDPMAYSIWKALEAGDPSKLFSHYSDFLEQQANPTA